MLFEGILQLWVMSCFVGEESVFESFCPLSEPAFDVHECWSFLMLMLILEFFSGDLLLDSLLPGFF